MAKRKMPEKMAEIIDDPVIVDETVAAPKNATGIVSGCTRLNVRKEPSTHPTARIATVVTSGSELRIDLEKSTEDWYKVTTESGVEGFCMKQFVTVK